MKKNELKVIICLLFFLSTLLSSCTSTRKIMESWMGHNKSEIILSWGPPQNIVSDGKGGEILIYGDERTVYAPVYNTIVQKTLNNYRQVYCNSNGVIYYIRWGQQ